MEFALLFFILTSNLMVEEHRPELSLLLHHPTGVTCVMMAGCYYGNNYVSLFDEKNYTAHKSVSEIVPIRVVPTRFGNMIF